MVQSGSNPDMGYEKYKNYKKINNNYL